MKRVSRQPTRLGAIDFAAEIGHELNLPLDRIGEQFSFDAATKLGLKDMRMLIGRRAERMFEYVVASLGHAELIQQEDAAAPLYAGAEVQAPDYFVALKSGERYFVEVKHTCADPARAPVSFSKNYLARLKRYAHLKGHSLTIAVYWRAVNQWTVNKVEDFETANGTINLRFPDALKMSIAGDFGDRMIGVVPPLICRLHAMPDYPSTIDQNGVANFLIGAINFFCEGQEILSDLEKQVAFYLIFHSRWDPVDPVATMDRDRVDYIDLIAQPPERNEEQEFELIGSTAGMVSRHFEWLTTADERIVRLTPQLTPAQMAPAFDESYRGQVLRMWQFELRPNPEPLIRKVV
ncbi:hypothetical protein [Roseateles flavus]|uniref:Restriction endonuclease n=1 Tax=Roseateles flavus TaxID=3149041 RepID=A0ABV0GGD1_9BURK